MLIKIQKLVPYLHFSEFRHLYTYFHSLLAWKMLSSKSLLSCRCGVHALDPSTLEADARSRRALHNETLSQNKQKSFPSKTSTPSLKGTQPLETL